LYLYLKDGINRIYHLESCWHIKRSKVEKIGSFADFGECLLSGYKFCKHCNPVSKLYAKEKEEISKYIKENGIWVINKIAHIYVDTIKSQWLIVYDENKGKLRLYHQNEWADKKDSMIPGYHLQDAKSNTVVGYLKYVVAHDNYRKNNKPFIPGPKLSEMKKGSKAWKKQAKKLKKRRNKKAANRVIRIIETFKFPNTDD